MATKPKVIDAGNGVRIIDPNPEFHTIEHEDLFVYASLVARTKGKSFLTETENGDFELDEIKLSTVDMVVSDSATQQNPNDGGTKTRQFLTTNWTNIGGSQIKGQDSANVGDLEGFGITSIDIDIKGSFIPQVVINFVDIRGATLFEQGSCSPYGLFFHLPYPLFELTIKGYYGKPVTYYLNLVKFNTKFNTATGNFECKGEFIGWSYAFLADMLMGYIRCSSYMFKWNSTSILRQKYDETIKYYIDNGVFDKDDYLAYLDETKNVLVEGTNTSDNIIQPFCEETNGGGIKCVTIDDLLIRITQVKDFLGQAKSDTDYIETAGLLKVRNILFKMQEEVRKFARRLEEDFSGQITGGRAKATNSSGRDLKERYVFNAAPTEDLKNLLKEFWSRPTDGQNTGFGNISSYVPQAKESPIIDTEDLKTCGGNHVAVLSAFNKNNGITRCEPYSSVDDENYFSVLDFLDSSSFHFQKGMLNDETEGISYTDRDNLTDDDYYIDLGYVYAAIQKDIEKLDELIEEKRNFVKESIDKGVVEKLGFRPTIRNIFTILCCNVETFMEMLLECSIEAEEEHNTKDIQVSYNETYGDGQSSNEKKLLEAKEGSSTNLKKIFPWPTYYERDYRSSASYNNDKSTETKEQYPGLNPEFINWPEVRFVEDFIEACQQANDTEDLLKEDKTGQPGYDNYTPINPLESKIFGKDVQCKYRSELGSFFGEGDFNSVAYTAIAERMFITLDFSYFDIIRYNPLNVGMGFTFPWRNRNETGNQSLSEYQTRRLWQPTLYLKGTNNILINTLAQIDAQNLISCIDKVETLQKLNLAIGSGDLMGDIEDTLNENVNNATSVDTSNLDLPWFNTSAKVKDVAGDYEDVITTNFDSPYSVIETDFAWEDDYWAYHPEEGYITFLGSGSGESKGSDEKDSAIRIYDDIRKMKPNYLFQLLEKEAVEDVFRISYGTSPEEIQQRIEGNDDDDEAGLLSWRAEDLFTYGEGTVIPKKEFGKKAYSYNNETKLIIYNQEMGVEQIRLFTTLRIGNPVEDNWKPFDITYSMLPFYPVNEEVVDGTAMLGGSFTYDIDDENVWYSPYQQTSYMAGAEGDFNGDSLLPIFGWTMEVPGKGIWGEGYQATYHSGGKGVNTTTTSGTFDRDYYVRSLLDEGGLPGGNAEQLQAWRETAIWNSLNQTPLWLDNVGRFRFATTRTTNSGGPDNRNTGADRDWGPGRPMTVAGTNSFEFKYPELKDIVTSYSDTDKKTNFSSGGGEGNDSPGSKLKQKQIERRNLAYLFLSSCKPTPFITCESSTFARTPNNTTFGGTAAGTAFNYKGGHYAKSIIPFVKSQGLVKLPKLWVLGMGAVMWRWKTYMGANTDEKGNIRWRSPGFKEEPIGIDPIAQPGHPSTALETTSPVSGNDGCKIHGDFYRTNRSSTYDNNGTISFTNSLFNGEKGLWATPITTENFVQTSCFAASTMKLRGLKEAVSFGQITTFGTGLSDTGTQPGTTYRPDMFLCAGETLLKSVYGAAFDYWGVYNNDGILNKTIPQAVPWDWNKSYDDYVLLGDGNPNWPSVANPLDSEPNQSGWYYYHYSKFSGPDYENGSQSVSKGTWTAWQLDVGTLDNEKMDGRNSLGGSFLTGFDIALDNAKNTDSYANIILNQMKSAKEAACHTYMPMLWAPPWCHFYAEPVNTRNTLGPARQDNKDIGQTSIPDSCFTTIPIDMPFRDYVGNFGYLGDKNSNYASQSIGSVVTDKTFDIPSSWTNLTKKSSYYNVPSNTVPYTSFFIKASANAAGTNNTEWKESLYFTDEGGKYAELMALLPSFVKERFVEEFEKWCDGDWKDKYLKVIDPVNFDWDSTDDGDIKANTNSDLKKVTKDIYKRDYYDNNLLANSYRLNSLNDDGGETDYPFSNIIGQYGGGEWMYNIGNSSYHALITLNKKNSDNGGIIKKLEKELVKDYYYAMIATPKVFGLDVFNGDNGGQNQAFYANKRLVKTYTEAFQKEWQENWKYKQNQLNNDEIDNDTSGSVLDDNDVKLAMYRSFKSIVDKWISSTRSAKSGTPKYFFNILQNEGDAFFDKTTTPLAGHFSYVNRIMGEIGNKAVLDVIPLEKIVDNPKMSLYNLMADLLGENKFDFFPLPSFTNFTNNNRKDDINKTAEEMFTPFTSTISKSSGPQFICMYVGGTSRILDLSSNKSNCKIDQDKVSYNDDGMSLPSGTDSGSRQPTPNEYAKPMSEEPLAPENEKFNYKDDSRIEGKGYTAFRVAYGLENQNMFKSIEVDQAEFSETNESLMVIDAMAKKGDPADRTQKGNNLHNVYLTRSYTCKVESLGNMTIQPLQYFELTNVPMFYGTYLITEVSHNMKPHHITTSFKGTRQPIATVPVVEDVATAMNLSLKSIKAAEGNNNVLNGGFGGGGGDTNIKYPPYLSTITLPPPSTETVTINGVDTQIKFVDIGKDNKDLYANHAWKQCSDCIGNGKPGQLNKSYYKTGHPKAGQVKDSWWVAYNQPTAKMTANKVEYIALHWTGGYRKITQSDTLRFRGLHYQFEVDTDGSLYQICDLERKAYHGSGLNSYSIGVSYAGGTENNKSGSVYVRTVDDWNKEDLNLNGRDTYNAKKQFIGLLDACTLAVQKYPGIKYITSHHWFSSKKSDVGDKFPWNIFLSKLKERGIDLKLKYDGTAPSGANWVANRKPDTTITGDIDLSVYGDALEQETEGNANQGQGQQNNIESDVGQGEIFDIATSWIPESLKNKFLGGGKL